MGVPRAILLCLFGSVLCLTVSQALQCYSFQHIYFGPFDLSGLKLANISCPYGCSEAVLSLDTGYRASVTLVQKGCWTGPPAGQMQSNEDALPPDYSVIRGCTTDWCNADFMTHDTIPNLSPAGEAGALVRCATRTTAGEPSAKVVSTLSPSAQPAHAQRHRVLRLRGDPPGGLRPEEVPAGPVPPGPKRLLPGHGKMSVDNFSVPVYIRTCHRPSCTIMGTTSPWTDIDLQGFCCEGPLCNGGSVTQPFTIASATRLPWHRTSWPCSS
ncbi:hypothetical protein QTO34_010296 [Cnephaeus nilssonii]|uniref:UPAR/Ly6 domain-containing protein n=1 Tax=Cnephaeus nilssonii TaxID=3371016 RepID=A0AA40HG12_CNENI|nr:hypothetical protein QTO34_010296 [Eptesicus nilssonii]